MSEQNKTRISFPEWISQPQTLIALSAVLLSLCGLFISIYEASLMRQAQRASVWPNVEVAVSINPGKIEIWVENTGIGPSRIRAATLVYEGETIANWAELVRSLGEETGDLSGYQSLIGGRVLPSASSPETIFRVGAEDTTARAFTDILQKEIRQGSIDVAVCYCSVYEECWTANMQDGLKRAQGIETPSTSRAVDDCSTAERSGI